MSDDVEIIAPIEGHHRSAKEHAADLNEWLQGSLEARVLADPNPRPYLVRVRA